MRSTSQFRTGAALLAALALAPLTWGQSRSLVGTVGEIRAQAAEFDLKPDSGPAAIVQLSGDTVLQRVRPGEKDLKNAAPIRAAELASGDRVLVTLLPDSQVARRVVVMPASAIAQRHEADRQDWQRRGLAGVVASRTADRITLRMRSFRGESQATVTVTAATTFRRYAPDSVKFADARPSRLAEVNPGDQLRARGRKSEDGLSVEAEEVVFGSFTTRAGSVLAVDPEKGQITVKDLETSKPLLVKVTADSQLKKMPNFAGMGTGAAPGPPSGGGRGGPFAGPAGGPGAPGGPAGAGGAGPPDFAQMLERMPPATLAELKPGETVVVSSTRGASRDSVTAIMLLANAEFLLRMAAMQSQATQAGGMSPGVGMGMGGTMGSSGMGGIEMPGMLP